MAPANRTTIQLLASDVRPAAFKQPAGPAPSDAQLDAFLDQHLDEYREDYRCLAES
jgi:hypothetical protein